MADSQSLVLIPPKNLLTEEQFQIGVELTKDDKIISDVSGLTNKDKWERLVDTFRIDPNQHTIFSELDVVDIMRRDNGKMCEAAAFMCDLRCQWLAKMIDKYPVGVVHWHRWYVMNRQWLVPLRERARMHYLGEALKHHARLH